MCVKKTEKWWRFDIVRVKEDMTGWKMWEHGVPDSRWIVIEQAEDYINPNGIHAAMWKCMCNCGNSELKIVSQGHLRHGDSLSCGCLSKEKWTEMITVHGKSKTKLYPIWLEMKQRCNNPKDKNYKNYGARGITVCDEWNYDFAAFYNWSTKSGYKNGLSIDREDVNGNYCPENCRWVGAIVQGRNQRIRSDNTSGTKGVNWDVTHKRWVVRITVNKKRICLGYFTEKQDAINARIVAEKKYWGDKNDL